MKFCLLFSLSPCAWYCLLIGSQLTTWSQGNLHYIRLHFFQLDREFFCLLPSLTRLYSTAASPSERLRLDGSLAIISYLSLCGREWDGGGRFTFAAFRMGAYSRWALIRGWALIRINKVFNLSVEHFWRFVIDQQERIW